MRNSFFLFLFIFLNAGNVLSQTKIVLNELHKSEIKKEISPFLNLTPGEFEAIFSNQVISSGEVNSKNSEQNLKLLISGLHPKSCQKAMRKLSLYENYSNYMDFIKKSSYNEKTQEIFFLLDHALMPFAMSLKFNIPRIQKEGHYPFTFKEGFLKDLQGTIIVKDVGNFCLLGLKADWKGEETKIPNLVFETFLETVGKIGLEHLIRVSIF